MSDFFFYTAQRASAIQYNVEIVAEKKSQWGMKSDIMAIGYSYDGVVEGGV